MKKVLAVLLGVFLLGGIAYAWNPSYISTEELLNKCFNSTNGTIKATISGSADLDRITCDSVVSKAITADTVSADTIRTYNTLSSDRVSIWGGGRTYYAPLGTDINALIASSTISSGDTIQLGAGTYTITADIDVTKGIKIVGQGEKVTNITCVTDNKRVFDITASGVSISNLTINNTTATVGDYTIYASGGVTNLLIESCTITVASTGGSALGIGMATASGTIRDCVIDCQSVSGLAEGIFATSALGGHVVRIYDSNISAIGTATQSEGIYCTMSAAGTMSVASYGNKIACTGAAATGYGVCTNGAGASIKLYGDYVSGSTTDAVNTAGTLTAYGGTCFLNNTSSGTITYEGTIVTKKITADLVTCEQITADTVRLETRTASPDVTSIPGPALYAHSDGHLRFYGSDGIWRNVVTQDATSTGIPQSEPATGNMLVGTDAGKDLTTANYNTFLGVEAGEEITTSPSNVAVGYQAGGGTAAAAGTGAGCNTSVGTTAGAKLTTGTYNTFVGERAGAVEDTGAQNTYIGVAAGLASDNANYNTCVGAIAGQYITTGSENVAVGYDSGRFTTGSRNVGVGVQATNNTTASDSTGVGHSALWELRTSARNTGVGSSALCAFNTAPDGADDNTGVGYRCGGGVTKNQTAAFEKGCFFGVDAGGAITSGANNICLGYAAGDNITSGSNNLILGYNINADSATANGQMNIGGVIKGTGIDGINPKVTVLGKVITGDHTEIYNFAAPSNAVWKTLFRTPKGKQVRITKASAWCDGNLGSSVTFRLVSGDTCGSHVTLGDIAAPFDGYVTSDLGLKVTATTYETVFVMTRDTISADGVIMLQTDPVVGSPTEFFVKFEYWISE